jgi:pyruvate kinase
MEHSSRPTRAEASDVFNAVLDGTDAVMLSGESAVGEYPIDAVTTMRRICAEAEAYVKSSGRGLSSRSSSLSGVVDPLTEASVNAASLMAHQLDAGLIVVTADSGLTALALGNRRPAAVILALPKSEQVARSLSLCWGVTSVVLAERSWAERVLVAAVEWAKSHGLVQSGQQVVLLRRQVVDGHDIRAVLAGTIS